MSESPYIPFYTSDFLGGTGGMTAATKGVYITLLCIMYEHEAPLGQSWDSLARRCGCTLPAFRKAVKELEADRKINVSVDGIWSDKCEKHIAARRGRQSSAKAAAEKRWEKSKEKQCSADATALPAQCQPEPEPYTEETSVSSGRARKRATRLSDSWVLPKDWGEWALSEGWSDHTIRREAEKFRDYWISVSGQKAAKLDWKATWRNWMRNVPKEERQRHGRRDGEAAALAQRIGEKFAARDMDSWPGSDAVVPLLPARGPGRGPGGSD